MNRRSFLARFVGGLAAISLRLEELPKIKVQGGLGLLSTESIEDYWVINTRRRIFYDQPI